MNDGAKKTHSLKPKTLLLLQQLDELATILAVSSHSCKFIGLSYGMIGIAVFFFHYARYKDNMLFANYALKLIEKAQENIHNDSPLNYAEGLTGIGTGIEYIAQQGFLDIDTDDILYDFDKKIAEMTPKHKLYLSFQVLVDMKRYFSVRLENPKTKSTVFLYKSINEISAIMELHERVGVTFEERPNSNKLSQDNPDNLGIEGLAGKGLALLEKLNPKHDTWLSLKK